MEDLVVEDEFLENIMRLGITKCNCDVLDLIPADKRFVYNPVRIKIKT